MGRGDADRTVHAPLQKEFSAGEEGPANSISMDIESLDRAVVAISTIISDDPELEVVTDSFTSAHMSEAAPGEPTATAVGDAATACHRRTPVAR